MNKLFNELRRRNVFRVAGVYGVVGWLLAQVAATLENAVSLPAWFDGMVVSLLLLGFPVAMIFAWAFEMTPEGVKRTAAVPEGESIAAKTGKTLDYVIIGGLALVAVMIVADRMMPDGAASLAGATRSGDAIAEAHAASIAVLPFADMSATRDQEYFSDGIAEEILNVLVRVEGLNVASRTSSFQFKGREIGIPEIARQLNVRHVLEGSVRKAGDTLRITAQLIDTSNDRHLWSQTFDRPLTAENIFEIQDEIAQAIVHALGQSIDALAVAKPQRAAPTANLSAYDLYLQARANYQQRLNFEASDALLAEALERDANFADAWALRAANMSLFKEYVATDESYQAIGDLVEAYAGRALELNPDNARAIAARANFRMTSAWNLALKHDLGEIIVDLKRAIALDPRDSSAMNWLGMLYALVGENDNAVEIFAACTESDPLFGPCAENYYDVLFAQGHYDEAWARYQEVLDEGIVVGGWANFSLLAHFNEKTAFMQATNHPAWLNGWRRHEELYEAFKHPGGDHSELIADINEFLRSHPHAPNSYSILLIPIGDFDQNPYPNSLWGADYAAYRRSPQFKSFVRESGILAYWREHGFPAQCKPVGPQSADHADFKCE